MEIDVNINCFQLPTLKYWSWKRPQERLWGDTDLGSNIACVRWYHLWACFLMWHGGWGGGCGRGPLAECACPAQVLCTASAVSRPCWGEVGRPDKSSSPAGLQGLRGAGARRLLRSHQAASGGVVKESKRTRRFSCERFNANNMVLLGLGVFYYLFT